MTVKVGVVGLAMVVLAGCTDATIHRVACSSDRTVTAFNDERWHNVWVVREGPHLSHVGHGAFCVSPNGKYVVSADSDKPDRVLVAELSLSGVRTSSVKVGLPPDARLCGVGCDDVRAVIGYCRDGAEPVLWRQIRLTDRRTQEAAKADWDTLPAQTQVSGEEVEKRLRQFKVGKGLTVVEESAAISPNRIFLESDAKRSLLLQEDAFTMLGKWLPKMGILLP